ncbi:MAG TPA: tetratricopeptide repeat protein [Kofleriaceae bacterium]
MRFVALLVLAACGSRAATPTIHVPASPTNAPASDLSHAKPSGPTSDTNGARDPRVTDLDIIKITASTQGVGGEITADHVATSDLFKEANEAAKAKQTERAIALYRRIVAEFPESKYAPVSLFNIAAILDARGDYTGTVGTLLDLVKRYPNAHESIDGHLYIAALQSEHQDWPEALATLDAVLARANLTYADRIEAFARKGFIGVQQKQYAAAETSLDAAIGEWRRAPHIDDPYYIAMAMYFRGEVAHQKFLDAPLQLPDAVLYAGLEHKRQLAVQAYDTWKESLGFHQAYWATAAGYQMSQIFVELWRVTVTAPYPVKLEQKTRAQYVIEVHDRVREHLTKALDGHRMNVELAKAYGVETTWSKGSAQQAVEIVDLLAKDNAGNYTTPPD